MFVPHEVPVVVGLFCTHPFIKTLESRVNEEVCVFFNSVYLNHVFLVWLLRNSMLKAGRGWYSSSCSILLSVLFLKLGDHVGTAVQILIQKRILLILGQMLKYNHWFLSR